MLAAALCLPCCPIFLRPTTAVPSRGTRSPGARQAASRIHTSIAAFRADGTASRPRRKDKLSKPSSASPQLSRPFARALSRVVSEKLGGRWWEEGWWEQLTAGVSSASHAPPVPQLPAPTPMEPSGSFNLFGWFQPGPQGEGGAAAAGTSTASSNTGRAGIGTGYQQAFADDDADSPPGAKCARAGLYVGA